MTQATGFLVRTTVNDTGTMPRSGDWTGCPDILVNGTDSMTRDNIISSYGSVTNKNLTMGLTNFLYLRAKNMNSTPLTQVAYMFQVPGTLVMQPQLWYKATNLVGYDVKVDGAGTPDDPKIVQKYQQTLTANGGQIAASNAFVWAPDSQEHHCLVGVIANSWHDIMSTYPGGGSMDALATWIYTNPSFGWHNVNIVPLTTTVYESKTHYVGASAPASVTFSIKVENAPVGAKVSFAAESAMPSGKTIGLTWVAVPAPAGGGSINPEYESAQTMTVDANFETIIVYRTDFNGLPVPANFKMHLVAHVDVVPQPAANSHIAAFLRTDSQARSYARTFAPHTIHHNEDAVAVGRGLRAFRAVRTMTASWDDDDGDDTGNTPTVVVGSHSTTPVHS